VINTNQTFFIVEKKSSFKYNNNNCPKITSFDNVYKKKSIYRAINSTNLNISTLLTIRRLQKIKKVYYLFHSIHLIHNDCDNQ